jgi:hypothetical protein
MYCGYGGMCVCGFLIFFYGWLMKFVVDCSSCFICPKYVSDHDNI